ncbi:MAG TPA: HemK2/MTQ2 family protein methyltransferase [Solirubrobacterales bacterium]|nr:HemK2/MTQ2 family protein methyltransferase [Solirubrobacterales bacterium]
MRLITLPGVFQPRSDSWMLADVVSRRARPGQAVLDPFTGSGILAIAAAQSGAETTAIDISKRAVLCARLNARLNGVRLRVLRAADLDPVGDRRFDLIVANPPYVPSPDREAQGAARAWEGGTDGRRFVDRMCAHASRYLRAGGRLLMIHSSVCGEDETLKRLEESGLTARVLERQVGPVGPLMAAGMNGSGANGGPGSADTEELLIFEAEAPA